MTRRLYRNEYSVIVLGLVISDTAFVDLVNGQVLRCPKSILLQICQIPVCRSFSFTIKASGTNHILKLPGVLLQC